MVMGRVVLAALVVVMIRSRFTVNGPVSGRYTFGYIRNAGGALFFALTARIQIPCGDRARALYTSADGLTLGSPHPQLQKCHIVASSNVIRHFATIEAGP